MNLFESEPSFQERSSNIYLKGPRIEKLFAEAPIDFLFHLILQLIIFK